MQKYQIAKLDSLDSPVCLNARRSLKTAAIAEPLIGRSRPKTLGGDLLLAWKNSARQNLGVSSHWVSETILVIPRTKHKKTP